ncbi:MAG: peptidylprolyl isomerase [Planctomycetota bacterium]|jgi:parvulin-like peptidyl-prolyl isomerase
MTLIISGEKIEDSVIQQEAERLRPHYEQVFSDKDPQEREVQLLDWSRENVIERVLLNQHAKKCGKQIPKADLEAAFERIRKQYQDKEQLKTEFGTDNEKQIKEQIELRMKAEQLLQDVCKDLPEPSDDAVLEFYEGNKEQFKSDEQVRVAHIVKHISGHTDEAAAYNTIVKAENELENGAVFEMLVAKYSDCPENGGDLGYITKGEMVEEFDDAVFNLGVNKVSKIFRTRFGYHIAKLYDRKPAVIPSLKEVKNQVVHELKEQMRNNAIDEFVDRLKSKANIEEV